MVSVLRSIADAARRWANRRVARQSEVENVPGVDEPKHVPDPLRNASDDSTSPPDERR